MFEEDNLEPAQQSESTSDGLMGNDFSALSEPSPSAPTPAQSVKEPSMEDIMSAQYESVMQSQGRPTESEMSNVRVKEFEQLNPAAASSATHGIDMLLDVTLPIAIELGRTNMSIEDVLNLGPGSIVELNKLAGEPVDLLINEKLIARGEVVVVDENFGIRITTMVSQQDRIKSLR
jgi:flagellar motor switch protein FliN/FliY